MKRKTRKKLKEDEFVSTVTKAIDFAKKYSRQNCAAGVYDVYKKII